MTTHSQFSHESGSPTDSAAGTTGSAEEALHLGAFAVDRRGRLRAHRPHGRPALHFRWRGHDCTAVLRPGGLELSAKAGEVPSTATAAERREGVIRMLDALPADLPDGWNLGLSPSHTLWLEHERGLEDPTATRLVTEMVRFALTLDPYLDRLAAAGVEGSAWGTPST